jgi:GNAT superfamily N-acetyltransferase
MGDKDIPSTAYCLTLAFSDWGYDRRKEWLTQEHDDPAKRFVIACIEEHVVGAMFYTLEDPEVVLWLVVVEPSQRRTGIGTCMMKVLLKDKEVVCRGSVSARTEADCTAACEFLRANGFLAERYTRYSHGDWTPTDLVDFRYRHEFDTFSA